MKVIIFGGTGEVGGAVVRALLATDACTQLTMLNRRRVAAYADEPKVEQVVLDTAADDFEVQAAEVAKGHDAAVCCMGIGKGTAAIPEDKLIRIEVDTVGAYARGCKAVGIETFALLTAVGTDENSDNSRVKYIRVMGKKLNEVLAVGFARLGVFRPGTIVGNKHTPGWVEWIVKLLPGSPSWGAVEQADIGRAFAAYVTGSPDAGVAYFDNADIRSLASS